MNTFIHWLLGRQAEAGHALARPAQPTDDLLITEPRQIAHQLTELVRLGRALAVQDTSGQFAGRARLSMPSSRTLHLQLHEGSAAAPGTNLQWPLNATACTARGVLLFSLSQGQVDAAGAIHAPWPEQLIHVQSRRHYRLNGLAGLRRRAWLSRLDTPEPLAIHDLSEEGIGLQVPAPCWTQAQHDGQATLHLDGQRIPVPLLEVVHARASAPGQGGTIGARMLGLSEEQLRALRRWLALAQSGQLAAPNEP